MKVAVGQSFIFFLIVAIFGSVCTYVIIAKAYDSYSYDYERPYFEVEVIVD